jgi:hypothetical protein
VAISSMARTVPRPFAEGGGGLTYAKPLACNRLPPHAQIFFRRGIPLIIFFKSKKSNGGALSSALQCKPSRALKCGATGGGCVVNGLPRICFQRQFGQTGGRYQGREGGLNLSRLVGQGPRSGPAHFREIQNYFFFGFRRRLRAGHTENVAKFRVGGIGRGA